MAKKGAIPEPEVVSYRVSGHCTEMFGYLGRGIASTSPSLISFGLRAPEGHKKILHMRQNHECSCHRTRTRLSLEPVRDDITAKQKKTAGVRGKAITCERGKRDHGISSTGLEAKGSRDCSAEIFPCDCLFTEVYPPAHPAVIPTKF